MALDKIIVIIIGLLGTVFVYWFFLMKKEKEVMVTNSIDIIVDGGYQPEVVVIPVGQTSKLSFLRKDSNSCLEEIVLGDFKIKKSLPLNERVTIELTPEKVGEYKYSCGMGMFHGKVIVK